MKVSLIAMALAATSALAVTDENVSVHQDWSYDKEANVAWTFAPNSDAMANIFVDIDGVVFEIFYPEDSCHQFEPNWNVMPPQQFGAIDVHTKFRCLDTGLGSIRPRTASDVADVLNFMSAEDRLVDISGVTFSAHGFHEVLLEVKKGMQETSI